MLKKILLSCALVAAVATSLTGCGPKKPDGMPEVYPFTVKVVDGSTPIADVQVFFIYDGKCVVAGTTDAKGVATMQTTLQNYTEKGAPAGEYRVTCTKDPLAEHWKTPEEISKLPLGEQMEYQKEWQAKCDELPREIPIIWKNFDKTPLTAEVTAQGGEVVFDVEGRADE